MTYNWTIIANNNRISVMFYLCDTQDDVEAHLKSAYKRAGRSIAVVDIMHSKPTATLSEQVVSEFKQVWQTVLLHNSSKVIDVPCNGTPKSILQYVLKGLRVGTVEGVRNSYNECQKAIAASSPKRTSTNRTTLQDFCRRLQAKHPENFSNISFEKSVYERALQKMQVVCKQHPNHDWWVTPNQLLNGSKCPVCSEEDRERYRSLSKLVRAKLPKGEKLARKREELEAVAGVLKVAEEYTWHDFCKDIKHIDSNWTAVRVVDGVYEAVEGWLEKCKLTQGILISTWGPPVNGLVGPSIIITTPLQVFKKANWWPEKLLRVRPDLVVDFV